MTSAPNSVICLIAATGSVVLAFTVCVAPNCLAHSSFWSSTSTATIVAAPARDAPRIAASPTPPQPKTATLSPRVTPPVLIAAPSPAITPQPRRPATSGRTLGSTFVHCPAATRVFSANAPIPNAGDSSVPSSNVIGCVSVVRGEAVPGPTPSTGSTLAADRAPVQDHEVALGDLGDPRADHGDHSGRLVTQQVGEVLADAPLAVVQVRVAHAARLHVDHDLARTWIGHHDRLHGHRLPCARATTARTWYGMTFLLGGRAVPSR